MCDISDAIPRMGLKKFNWWSEALHGLANNGNVTVFPEPVGMAASFDDQLVFKIYNATSDETRAKYNEAKQKDRKTNVSLVFRFGHPMSTFSRPALGTWTGNIWRRPLPYFTYGSSGSKRIARSCRCKI
jgi:hypothetical protein